MRQCCIITVVLSASIGCVHSEAPPRLADIDVSVVRLPDSLESALDTDHTVELLSLNPEHPEVTPEDSFHGWEVLGRTQLNSDAGIEIVHGLKAGLVTAPNYAAACFNPRHGLRISAAENVVDVVICFECVQIYIYKDDERIGTLGTSDAPLKLFDRIVREHKLPMPPPANP